MAYRKSKPKKRSTEVETTSAASDAVSKSPERDASRPSSTIDSSNGTSDKSNVDVQPPGTITLWAFRLSAIALLGWMIFLVFLAYQVSQS